MMMLAIFIMVAMILVIEVLTLAFIIWMVFADNMNEINHGGVNYPEK